MHESTIIADRLKDTISEDAQNRRKQKLERLAKIKREYCFWRRTWVVLNKKSKKNAQQLSLIEEYMKHCEEEYEFQLNCIR